MFKKPKLRLVAIAAALVVGAFATTAGAASAAEYQSEIQTTEVAANSVGNLQFKLGGLSSPCQTTNARGKMVGTKNGAGFWGTRKVTLTPLLTSCTYSSQTVTVEPNGCEWTLEEPVGTVSPFKVKTITIGCPAGKEMKLNLKTGGCYWTIPAQSVVSLSLLSNQPGPPKSLELSLAANLNYFTSGGACGVKGLTQNELTGTVSLKGYSDAALVNQIGIFAGV